MASTTDCIKVLDLDGRLVSINDNGKAVLEIGDLTPLLGSCWAEWWNADRQTDASTRRALLHEQARLVAERAAATLDYDADRDAVRVALTETAGQTAPSDPTLPLKWLPRKTESPA